MKQNKTTYDAEVFEDDNITENGWFDRSNEDDFASSFEPGTLHNFHGDESNTDEEFIVTPLAREVAAKHEQAAINAERIWSHGKKWLPGSHPYPTTKYIWPSWARVYEDWLLIPMYFEGRLVNIQVIDKYGNKSFLPGGRKKGCYSTLGLIWEEIAICEDYASGCVLYESDGVAVAVAFDFNNLKPVALTMRRKYPDMDICIAANNDVEIEKKTGINIGLLKAQEAADAVGGEVYYPEFKKGEEGTTWHDHWRNE